MTHPSAHLTLLVAGLLATFGCSPPPQPSSPSVLSPDLEQWRTAALERGPEIVSQAGKALSGVLLEALQQGGATNALPLCSVQAIPLTAALAQANQVALRRVSHRPRNPINQANDQEIDLIERFSSQLRSGSKPSPEAVVSPSGAVTFYAPIVINTNLCLRCHGQSGIDLDPQIIPILQERYPQDQATGFALGDLRGLWRVDFTRPPLSKP